MEHVRTCSVSPIKAISLGATFSLTVSRGWLISQLCRGTLDASKKGQQLHRLLTVSHCVTVRHCNNEWFAAESHSVMPCKGFHVVA